MEEGKSSCCTAKIFAGVAIVVVLGAGYFGARKVSEHRAVRKADAQVQKGFGTLAADTIDRYRYHLSKSADGCKSLVLAYSAAKRADRLEWAGEACIDNGIETLEVYEGFASAEDLMGREGDAFQIMAAAVQKFPKSPEPHINIMKLYRKNKNENGAVAAFLKAVELSGGEQQLAFQALEYFSSINRWKEAKVMADLVKKAPTDNPGVKFMIAQAFSSGGDKVSAKEQVAAAQELMSKRPAEEKAALQKKYSALLRM